MIKFLKKIAEILTDNKLTSHKLSLVNQAKTGLNVEPARRRVDCGLLVNDHPLGLPSIHRTTTNGTGKLHSTDLVRNSDLLAPRDRRVLWRGTVPPGMTQAIDHLDTNSTISIILKRINTRIR